jgi:beta-xylosidase
MMQELNKNGLSFVPGSSPQLLLRTDRLQEMLIVEAPWLMHKDGAYFLFYSSSIFELPTYRVNVAKAGSLLGPYRKRDKAVVETDWRRHMAGRNSTWEGPGHASVVEDGAGGWWLVYHAWRYGRMNQSPGRMVLLDRLVWRRDPGSGEVWPEVAGRAPSDTQRVAPQG